MDDKYITRIRDFGVYIEHSILKVIPEYWIEDDAVDDYIYHWAWTYAHCENGPAFVTTHTTADGQISTVIQQWFVNGIRHREDGPAIINLIDNSVDDEYYYIDGELIGRNLGIYSNEAIQNSLLIK